MRCTCDPASDAANEHWHGNGARECDCQEEEALSNEATPLGISRHGIVRAMKSSWQYDWGGYPGGKCLLLTEGGIAVIGQLGDDKRGYMAWAPLPDRDREAEAALRR